MKDAVVKPPPCYPGMRIGLMGGSFNPPHAGHRHISIEALKRMQLDCVWWIVTPGNPLKSAGELVAFDERMATAKALVDHPRIIVTAFEAALPSAYTSETLAFLRRRIPGVRFVWIMGGDNLAGFHRWRGWRTVMETMPIAVFDRPGFRYRALASVTARAYDFAMARECSAAGLPLKKAPVWTYFSQPLREISSTQLRQAKARSTFGVPSLEIRRFIRHSTIYNEI
ncbi:MAG: nicotinate-nucleotide adenylyltransferase [Hyphomicrobiales bacterium]|nr:nicotinate-nucleotide adenylyltransferase [Hyphomicrobiales bacterium]